MSNNYIQKVALVGAGGHSGKYMASALLATGKHTVTAITRHDSTSQLPDGLLVSRVDYDNPSTLVSALRGQDALVITLAGHVLGSTQAKLIHAAADAAVPWILPNEWSPDAASEALVRDLDIIFEPKRKARELITSLGKSSWVAVHTGFWYEWSLAMPTAYGFDFEKRTVTLFDEGTTAISMSTWEQVGRTVAGLLSLRVRGEEEGEACLEGFRNGHVYVSSFTVSQMDMLESVLRVTGTKREDWKIEREGSRERHEGGKGGFERMDLDAARKWLYARVFYPSGEGNFEKTRGLQNEMLGLPKEDLDHYTKLAMERAKSEVGKMGY